MEAFNQSLFLMLNAGLAPSPAALAVATLLAKWLINGVPLLLAGMWLWGGRQARASVLMGLVTLTIALTCNIVLGWVWMHPRPFMIGLGHQYLAHDPESSFPSDHATVFFAIGIAMLTCRMHASGWMLLALGALAGGARVYLGVHYPFDILGSLLITTVCAWAAVALLNVGTLGQRCLQMLENLYRRLLGHPIRRGWFLP